MIEEKTVLNTFTAQGLDLSSPYGLAAEGKSPYCFNLWRDYSDDCKAIQTRPALRLFRSFEDNGANKDDLGGDFYIVPFGDGYVYKMGGAIYYSGETVPLVEGLSDENKNPENTVFRYAFYNNSMYIYEKESIKNIIIVLTFKDGKVAVKVIEIGLMMNFPDAFPEEYVAPTVLINVNSSGAGDKNLPFNMLSPFYTLQYLSEKDESGSAVKTYSLPLNGQPIMLEYTDLAGVKKYTSTGFSYNKEKQSVIITDIMPNTTFRLILLDSKRFDERDKVYCMKKFSIFDNRVFAAVSDNDEYKNRLIWSRAENPLYWADTDFVTDGQGGESVTDILPVGQYLAVFKKDTKDKNGIYLHYPTETKNEIVPKVYPSVYGLYDVGCINKNSTVNVNDNCFFLSYNGLNSLVGTDLNKISSVEHRSSFVDPALIADIKRDEKNVKVTAFRDYVCIYANGAFYLGDTKSTCINHNTAQRELNWYKWVNICPWTSTGADTAGKKNTRLLQLFEDNEGILCAVYYEKNMRYLVRFDNFEKDRRDSVIKYNAISTTTSFPIYSAVSTGYLDFGSGDRRKKSLRNRGFAMIEGDEIRVCAKRDWELRKEPEFLSSSKVSFIPYIKTDEGKSALTIKRKGVNIFYDMYCPDFLSLSVVYSSEKPMKFYKGINGAKIRERER